MKPLTAEEIAELRRMDREAESSRAAASEFEHAAWDAIPRLLDEVERSRALLKSLEWNGASTYLRQCPVCLAYIGKGHAPGCELAALLQP